MSKLEIYQSILQTALPEFRNVLNNLHYDSIWRRLLPTHRRRLREAYELAEAIHNIYGPMLDDEYTFHDVWMINFPFRSLWESNVSLLSRRAIGFNTLRMIERLPESLKSELEWSGPDPAHFVTVYLARVVSHQNGGFTRAEVLMEDTGEHRNMPDLEIRTSLLPPDCRPVGTRIRVRWPEFAEPDAVWRDGTSPPR